MEHCSQNIAVYDHTYNYHQICKSNLGVSCSMVSFYVCNILTYLPMCVILQHPEQSILNFLQRMAHIYVIILGKICFWPNIFWGNIFWANMFSEICFRTTKLFGLLFSQTIWFTFPGRAVANMIILVYFLVNIFWFTFPGRAVSIRWI